MTAATANQPLTPWLISGRNAHGEGRATLLLSENLIDAVVTYTNKHPGYDITRVEIAQTVGRSGDTE